MQAGIEPVRITPPHFHLALYEQHRCRSWRGCDFPQSETGSTAQPDPPGADRDDRVDQIIGRPRDPPVHWSFSPMQNARVCAIPRAKCPGAAGVACGGEWSPERLVTVPL